MDAIHDDVVEFALLLARLKKRTDRSYAALARRLGMTASTLHRYCTGEAVPLDFAGIERFAALCGASSEERVELHRRWILAVAARQRPRPSDARRAPTPDGTASTASTASTAAAAASPSPSSPADEAPEPTSPSTPDSEPTSPSTPRTGPASPATSRPGPASPGDPSPHPGRSRRRPVRSMALAASLAVALAGLTTSAAGPPSADGGSSASGRTTPKASAPATHSGNGPQENRTNAGTAPLTWTADSQVWGELECDHDYVIAKPPQQVPPPPNPADAAPWAASQGAVHGRDTNVRITVQGRGSAAVVLEALHVRVVNRTTPAARRGIAYSTADGCGATLQPRYFSVNLDARRPLAHAVPAGRPGSPSLAVDFPYRVSLKEPEVLLVSAGTVSCTCDWYLELGWSSQGRSGTARIDDQGRPFRTTSIKGLPHYSYRNPSGWVPMTTADDNAETGD
ncbi:helix-turn-helix domain-containing protein [Streptomyces sp. NPDC006446]|uniref:helix-turn-helix domain-containing protein n=1 Tax=Streptomyces sp. NPDC006446 TaxID=3154301 RepID=UPI0033B95544